jgi:hypothetical protein
MDSLKRQLLYMKKHRYVNTYLRGLWVIYRPDEILPRIVGTERTNPSFSDDTKRTARWLSFLYGQAVNNALEQAQFKNVAKSMFSGRKRTGFS